MLEEWTAEVTGRMHRARITGQQLAAECGYSAAYLSTVLNGKKGNEDTKQRIFQALERLETNAVDRSLEGGDEADDCQ